MKISVQILTILAAILFSASAAVADVRLPDVLGDGMVLQQKQKIPIWGAAEPGETVTIELGGQKKTVSADDAGKWRVELAPLKASFLPQTLTIAGKNKIELKNVLVGEVWLVSGQSNMQWTLAQANNGEAEVAAANHPNIRLFNTSREVAFKKKQGKLGEWRACSPETVKDFSAAGFYFAVELQRELNVPLGVINSSYGGSQAEAWTPVEYLNASPDLRPTVERTKIWDEERPRVKVEYEEALKKWRAEADQAKAAGAKPAPSPAVPDALRDYRVASSIYDGMIEPLMPFAIRGAVWYQGESNEARAEQYNILLPAMIKSWRERWGAGNFPFGIVQLPNYRAAKDEPEEAPWSFVREAQRRVALATENTGLIVTIDIGEANDIHPKNKLDVGKRMARWALKDVYGRKLVNSPAFKKAEIKGAKIVLTFDEVGAGLRIRDGSKLDEFAIAGSDRKWHWAESKIVGKNKIEVFSPAVAQPQAVRYAFNSNPKHPNLTNETGLPAAPFRTDNWADPTAGKR